VAVKKSFVLVRRSACISNSRSQFCNLGNNYRYIGHCVQQKCSVGSW